MKNMFFALLLLSSVAASAEVNVESNPEVVAQDAAPVVTPEVTVVESAN